MPAKIVSLHSKDNTIIYPETIVSAVHMPDGRRTLEADLEALEDGSCTIEFNEDGSITQIMTNTGMIITTEFGDVDGEIVETCTYADETPYYTKTTTFNDDGSITVSKVFADNSEPEEEPEENEEQGE